jgi:malate dehydrogenase (oxaloacetate-decarboxylating)(NADP+)
LRDPLINRGTGFSTADRRTRQLEGLLPPRVESLVEQAERVVCNIRDKHSRLDQYCYLSALRDENETLFYRVVLDNLEEMLPIIYTPTVGEACTQWSRIYERPRGLYVSAFQHRGRLAELLEQWPRPQASVIVVTDGGRILGLGDLGANGMGIPIGKLSLYTACAGVAPELCLPIALDVGTDNDSLRTDPLYLGERQARLTGEPYDEFIEEFVTAARTVFPAAILQFEDFNNACAFRLLDRYRNTLCCFNDDVQGTGAMGLAGLYSAGRITGQGLAEQRILFVGAGEAGLGFARMVLAAMQHEGLSEVQSKARCLFMDSRGLVVTSRTDLPEWKRSFAQDRVHTVETEVVIEDFAPTAIIGACGVGARFNEAMLSAMARLNNRPIVFALSNPTSKAECTAEQAYAWTQGRVVFASGSPFAPVTHDGRVYTPGQGNNSYVFPGVGLGLLLAGATHVSDEMFLAAAHALADCVSAADLERGRVFPPAAGMRDVAVAVAAAVATVAHEQGCATRPPADDFLNAAARYMYEPSYR